MGSISKMFSVDKKTLSEVIGIANKKHIDLILEHIERFVVSECERFKNWMAEVIGDRVQTERMAKSLMRQTVVYSAETFARNIRSIYKLRSVLGPDDSDRSDRIWTAFA